MRLLSRWAGVALVPAMVASLTAQGCAGPDVQAICEERESCTGGNEQDVEACVASQDAASDLAGIIGCGAEYDAYFVCFEENAQCRSQPIGLSCTSSAECEAVNGTCDSGQCTQKAYDIEDEDTCKAERNAYNSCT